jgi:hypothetical protein
MELVSNKLLAGIKLNNSDNSNRSLGLEIYAIKWALWVVFELFVVKFNASLMYACRSNSLRPAMLTF